MSPGEFDQCKLDYGYLPKGLDQPFSPRMLELRNSCVAKAHELGMCTVAMKVGGGAVQHGGGLRFPEERHLPRNPCLELLPLRPETRRPRCASM